MHHSCRTCAVLAVTFPRASVSPPRGGLLPPRAQITSMQSRTPSSTFPRPQQPVQKGDCVLCRGTCTREGTSRRLHAMLCSKHADVQCFSAASCRYWLQPTFGCQLWSEKHAC